MATWPLSGANSPVSNLKIVDLPAPLRPIKPTRPLREFQKRYRKAPSWRRNIFGHGCKKRSLVVPPSGGLLPKADLLSIEKGREENLPTAFFDNQASVVVKAGVISHVLLFVVG